MSIRTELDKTALYLRNARNAVIGRGGEISATAGFKDLSDAITNIPNDQTLAWQTVESNAKRVTVPSGVLPMAQIKKIGGMSYKSKNILKLNTLNETQSGVTITTNPDGSYTLNGTATASDYIILWSYDGDWEVGGYRFPDYSSISVKWQNEQSNEYPPKVYATCWDMYDGSFMHVVYEDILIQDLQEICVETFEGTVFDNTTLTIMVNEGKTALPYEPYFDGLRDSKTKSIVSEGANLIPYPYKDKSGKVQNGITFTVNDDGSVTVNGTATAMAQFSLYGNYTFLKSKGNYTLSGCPSGGNTTSYYLSFGLYKDSKWLFGITDVGNGSTKTVTIEHNKIELAIAIKAGTVCNNLVFKPVLNYGSTAVPFSAGRGIFSTTNIPEAVRNLEGYGLGINADYYNYIEWRDGRCYFIKAVDKIMFDGTENWRHYVEGEKLNQFHIYIDGLNNVSAVVFPMTLNNKYLDTTVTGRYKVFESLCSYNSGSGGFLINTLVATNVEEYKAYLAKLYAQGNPLTVIYALAEPIETDITDLMTVDNHIAVEGGGTVEFNNEYGYDIPNEINYLFNTAGG